MSLLKLIHIRLRRDENKTGQNRLKFRVHHAKKLVQLETSTPLPVVAVVTILSYGQGYIGVQKVHKYMVSEWFVFCSQIRSKESKYTF